jgi:transcriptional regulator GlxA family with amidase domain
MTPMAYLNRYRVNQAKLILTTTDRSITAVAMAVGFADNNYFSRVFRQEVGSSPLVYRREHRV